MASEKGAQYDDWMSQWGQISLDEVEIEIPEEIEYPNFVADDLEDLALSPEEQ